jgi:hypothetical protein
MNHGYLRLLKKISQGEERDEKKVKVTDVLPS